MVAAGINIVPVIGMEYRTLSGVAVLLVIIEQVKCLPYNEIVNIPFRDESMRYGQNLEVNGEKGTGQVEEFSKINLLLSI
ncbi:V-type proton ATPase subunit B1-like [Raphanus sativus]|uniref:V-type proton ATPase subunit B1-like n=1 Tax=Raphanus sativus TaxID=3726 RepID=A0A9W3DHG3_RAPSA|nr:V-type proton ATPase subunit B1-like [Raphanus sativus]XP_056866256.1 V-type proton ATPase subunit B1-like [Raphanus sativus]